MFHYVYILKSEKDSSFYIGYSENLKRRLKEHNLGVNFSAKSKKPWKIIFYEAYLNKDDAKRRERYLKTNQGSRSLKLMLKKYLSNNK